jgi:methionyl-tRNA formyltransferase
MKIIFAGTPEFAVASLNALIQSPHEVIAIYTQPDRPAGRGRKLTASPVKQLAMQQHIPIYQPNTLRDAQTQKIIQDMHADLMIVVAYGLILPKPVLNATRLGCINVHASLLPRWRGAAPIQRAILAGDSETGITIMQMDEGLDTGGMLLKSSCPISSSDTSQSLTERLSILGGELLVQALAELEAGTLKATPQDNTQATYAAKIEKTEGRFDWNNSAKELARKVRAFNPWPVAFCHWGAEVLRIWEAIPVDQTITGSPPGTILSANKSGIDVATGEGVLRMLKLQLPGGKPLTVTEFYNAKKELFKLNSTLN